jgi:hypothetical protein
MLQSSRPVLRVLLRGQLVHGQQVQLSPRAALPGRRTAGDLPRATAMHVQHAHVRCVPSGLDRCGTAVRPVLPNLHGWLPGVLFASALCQLAV